MSTIITVKTLNGTLWKFNFEELDTITLKNLVEKVNESLKMKPETATHTVSKVIIHGTCFTNWDRNLIECGYQGDNIVVLLNKSEQSGIQPQIVINPVPPTSGTEEDMYSKTYTGAEVKAATLKNGDIMFNIICNIASKNPLFLSYLAINPSLAKRELMKTLDNEDYKLTIKGLDETCDPIKATNMHPSGDSGYEIDLRNVEFLIMNSGIEHNKDQAMEVYLWCDRDIQRTLSALQNPAECPLLINNSK